MGRTRLTQGRLAAALGISQSRVSQLRARGMPTATVDAARRWRDANLDPVQVYAQGSTPDRPPSAAEPAPASLGEIVADLLDAASVDLVARLAANGEMTIEGANLAVSTVAIALAQALDRAGADGDPVANVAGPLSGLEGDAHASVRAAIEARVAAIRAELAAADLGAE